MFVCVARRPADGWMNARTRTIPKYEEKKSPYPYTRDQDDDDDSTRRTRLDWLDARQHLTQLVRAHTLHSPVIENANTLARAHARTLMRERLRNQRTYCSYVGVP